MHQSTGKRNKIAIYIIFLIILSTTSGKFSEQKKRNILNVDEIKVMGLSSDKNLEIQRSLNNIFHQNIFILEKEEINKIINKYNIIEEYSINKIYPSTLNIVIKPTKFVAKISDENRLIVGSNGKLISGEKSDINLPYIFGEFNSEDFLKFKKDIDKSKLNFSELKTVYFFPSSRWDILTTDGILIKLPKSNVYKSINMAYKIINSTKFKDKNIIDLRIKSHIVLE